MELPVGRSGKRHGDAEHAIVCGGDDVEFVPHPFERFCQVVVAADRGAQEDNTVDVYRLAETLQGENGFRRAGGETQQRGRCSRMIPAVGADLFRVAHRLRPLVGHASDLVGEQTAARLPCHHLRLPGIARVPQAPHDTTRIVLPRGPPTRAVEVKNTTPVQAGLASGFALVGMPDGFRGAAGDGPGAAKDKQADERSPHPGQIEAQASYPNAQHSP